MDENLLRIWKTMCDLQSGKYKPKSNQEKLKEYNKSLEKFKSIYNSKDLCKLYQTCTTDCKVGNTQKSFNNRMKPITFKEMTFGNTYRDRYITLEIVTELKLMASVMFLGKDDNGDLALIAIYNFENHYGTKDYQRLSYIFDKGKYILVLEPFYKIFGSGEDGIRIEDPNEIIIFDDREWLNKFLKAENKEESFKLFHDEEDKNYDDLYKEAYKSFSIQNYNTALAHFIKLKSLKPEEIKFDIKIVECYFNISYYSKTIEKCEEILAQNLINSSNGNEIFANILSLKLKSLINLKKLNEAKRVIEENKEFIINNETKFFLIEEEIKNKMKNSEGQFDFGEIYNKAKESFNVDVGEYVSKKLEIRFINYFGTAIYSKEKIFKGELLVVSKAMVSYDPNEKNKSKDLYLKFDNPAQGEKANIFNLVVRPTEKLEEILSYKLSNFPEDFSDFFCLFDGNNKNLNLEERKKNTSNDLNKIKNVIKYNSKTLYFSEEPISYGLWFYPSLFNHSCIPNCFVFGFGDILIITALNDIKANSELFISYFYNNDMLYDKRQEYLKTFHNFDCYCELCDYEKKKFKENKEKMVLDEYLTKLDDCLHNSFSMETKKISYDKLLCEKEVKKMVKFVEKNKKLFCCYELSNLYLKCAHCMRFYDGYLSYEYLEKSLKYCENRSYCFEKLTLMVMVQIARQINSQARIEEADTKFRLFWEKYFPNQKTFHDIIIAEYTKVFKK